MTQLLEKKTSLLVKDLDALILSIPHEDAISNEFFLTEGGIAPLKKPFFEARLARFEAVPYADELLPTLDLLIEKAKKKTDKEKREAKAVSYKEEGFQRRPGEKVTGAKGTAGEGKTLATGQWVTAEGDFAPWSSVGKLQAAKKGFTSGFSRQMKMEVKASKKPESKLHKEDPRKYWNERGKLASSFATTMEGINSGAIKGKDANRLMGVDRNGKNVSGLNPSQQKRRSELIQQQQSAGADGLGKGEKGELNKLNSNLSLREKAEAIGTDLDMVEYHVNQIKDSGSAMRRALDPALGKVAPPVGAWPDSLGGAEVAERATKNFQKVTNGLPKSQPGSLDRQYEAADRGEAKGEAEYKAGLGKDEQQRTQQAPTAHEYKDRIYRTAWTGGKAPQGVRVYTSSRGKQYYLSSEHKLIQDERTKAREEKQKSKAAEAKARAEKKAKKPTKQEEEKEKEEAKVPVPVGGGPEESPDDSDSGAGAGAGAGAETPSPSPKEPTPEQSKVESPKEKVETPEVSIKPDEKGFKAKADAAKTGASKKKGAAVASTGKKKAKAAGASIKPDKEAFKAKAAAEAKKKTGAEKKPKEEGGILDAIKQGWKEGTEDWKSDKSKKKRSKAAKKGVKTKKKKAKWEKKAAAQLAGNRAKAKEEKVKEQSKLEQKRKEYDDPEVKAKRIDKGIKKLGKLANRIEREERKAKGEDLPGRIDSWLKKHPKVENLIRGSADDPENMLWLRLSDDLVSMSKEDASDFLDRLDKGGEVFFKGYIQSFNAEIQAEQEAAELVALVDNLSIVKNKVK